LLVDGRPAVLGARAFDVLLAVGGGRERVLTKGALLERVWPGLGGGEHNLQVQVPTPRKPRRAHSGATLPGRGYRFTLSAELEERGASAGLRHNLPAPLNRFIGREREMRELASMLGSARLVTLASVGGTGKTRLALEVAREVLGLYPDGVW